MSNTLFANIKNALSVTTTAVHSAEVERNLDASTPTGIQHMTVEEYSAVAGGPQVENDPQV